MTESNRGFFVIIIVFSAGLLIGLAVGVPDEDVDFEDKKFSLLGSYNYTCDELREFIVLELSLDEVKEITMFGKNYFSLNDIKNEYKLNCLK